MDAFKLARIIIVGNSQVLVFTETRFLNRVRDLLSAMEDHVVANKQICVNDQALGQNGWLLTAALFFFFFFNAFLMNRDEVEVHKNA